MLFSALCNGSHWKYLWYFLKNSVATVRVAWHHRCLLLLNKSSHGTRDKSSYMSSGSHALFILSLYPFLEPLCALYSASSWRRRERLQGYTGEFYGRGLEGRIQYTSTYSPCHGPERSHLVLSNCRDYSTHGWAECSRRKGSSLLNDCLVPDLQSTHILR